MNQANNDTIWSFEPYFSDIHDPRVKAALDESGTKVQQFVAKWKQRDDYLTEISALRESLDDYESVLDTGGLTGSVFEFVALLRETNQKDEAINATYKKVEKEYYQRSNSLTFYTVALTTIEESTMKQFITQPEVAEYRHFLENILTQKKHTLTEKEENIVSLFEPTSYGNWTYMTDSLLNKSEGTLNGEKKSINELLSYLTTSGKHIDEAGNEITRIQDELKEIAEKELNSVLEYKRITDDLRGFTRPDSSRLLNDDVREEVIDALVQTVTDNFDISQEFYTLKAKKLNRESINYYERFLKHTQFDREFSWEDTKKTTLDVLGWLDTEFKDTIQGLIDNNRVDVFPRSGKTGGAFCDYGSKDFPIYILLNHGNNIRGVETFAHESGHAIHHNYFNQNQNRINAQGSTFTAEVASTFVEDFVLQKVPETLNLNEEEQEALAYMKLEGDISSIFRQVALYNFETELHSEFRSSGYIPHQRISSLFKKHMQAYMGPSVSFDNGQDLWWVYWSHIRYYFYVYSYASGLLISKTMGAYVKEDHSYVEKVKDFMKAGVSESGETIFANMGIDISTPSFWQKGLDSIRANLEALQSS
jgi:oligoendopeptidase F